MSIAEIITYVHQNISIYQIIVLMIILGVLISFNIRFFRVDRKTLIILLLIFFFGFALRLFLYPSFVPDHCDTLDAIQDSRHFFSKGITEFNEERVFLVLSSIISIGGLKSLIWLFVFLNSLIIIITFYFLFFLS